MLLTVPINNTVLVSFDIMIDRENSLGAGDDSVQSERTRGRQDVGYLSHLHKVILYNSITAQY